LVVHIPADVLKVKDALAKFDSLVTAWGMKGSDAMSMKESYRKVEDLLLKRK